MLIPDINATEHEKEGTALAVLSSFTEEFRLSGNLRGRFIEWSILCHE